MEHDGRKCECGSQSPLTAFGAWAYRERQQSYVVSEQLDFMVFIDVGTCQIAAICRSCDALRIDYLAADGDDDI
eukprot:scaffold393400_cov17-Prasinocladus_malaysianus.AAC.1